MPLQIESKACSKPPLLFSIDSIVGIPSYQRCDSSSKESKSSTPVPKSNDVINSDESDEEISIDFDRNKNLFCHLASLSKVYPKNPSLNHLNSANFNHPLNSSSFNSAISLPIDNHFNDSLRYHSPDFVNHLNSSYPAVANELSNGNFNSTRFGGTSSMPTTQPNLMRYFGSSLPSLYPPSLHQYPFPIESDSKYCQLSLNRGSFPGFLQSSLFAPYLLTKPKRIRTAFSPNQLLKLEHAFEKNHYVIGPERKQLAQSLNLSETQVKVWFQNRRTKQKRQGSDDLDENEEDEEDEEKRKAKKLKMENE